MRVRALMGANDAPSAHFAHMCSAAVTGEALAVFREILEHISQNCAIVDKVHGLYHSLFLLWNPNSASQDFKVPYFSSTL